MTGSAPAAPRVPLSLVFGATGYVGTNLVPFLVARGERVRAAARSVSTGHLAPNVGFRCCQSLSR